MSETSLQNAYDRIEELELKLVSANEQIRRLEEAGDELMYDNDDMTNINRWHKAKEIKS